MTRRHLLKKDGTAILEIRPYESLYGVKVYELIYIANNLLVTDGYYYLSTAKGVGQALIDETSFPFLTPQEKDYIQFYQYNDIKKPLTIKEWVNGPDYKALQLERDNRELALKQEREYQGSLFESDDTLVYLSDTGGDFKAGELRGILDGDRLPGKGVYSVLKK